jgi:hypothetical protein
MACINCFFAPETQRQIKESCFGLKRFEEKIRFYKEKYNEKIQKLVQISDCDCQYNHIINEVHLNWTNSFLHHLQINITKIIPVFDVLYEAYILFISKSHKHASDFFWNEMQKINLLEYPVDPILYCRLLFRGRIATSSMDIKNPLEYFHIPFNQRTIVDNQRFNISGQPMLYLSNSVYSLTKELDEDISNIAIAAFLPNFSKHYSNIKVNEIKNNIFEYLVEILPGICDVEAQIEFENLQIKPNLNTIVNDVQRSILCEVLTFPTENKSKFVEEYVLPQIYTTLLIENGYNGVIFPSAKANNDIVGQCLYSRYNVNLAFFVHYSLTNNYDEILYDTFYPFLIDPKEQTMLSTSDVLSKFNNVTDYHKTYCTKVNNNDYLLAIANTKLHIESLAKANVNGKIYFDTKLGNLELNFYFKLAEKMYELIQLK